MMTASIHQPKTFDVDASGQHSWLTIGDKDGPCVTLFIPLAVAEALASTWREHAKAGGDLNR